MALGAQEDGGNGPTSTDQQPLLHRRLSQRAPFESSKDQQAHQRTRPSPQPGNEYSKAPHQHRPQARFPRVQALLKAARRLSRQAADLLLWDLGFEDRPLLLRLNQTFKRLVYSWRSELQLLRQYLLSQQARDKFITALRLIEAVSDVSANGRRKWRPESNATTSWAAESAANNPWTSQTNASTAWQEAA